MRTGKNSAIRILVTPLQKIREAYSKVMAMRATDLWTLDFVAATFLSCKLPRHESPILGTLIAAPGTGKTEIMKPYCDMPGCGYEVSDFTANAWVSGSPTISTSIFHKTDRRCIIIPDLTPLMDKDGTKLKELLSALRIASDGSYSKDSGAKDEKSKPATHTSVMAAATEKFFVFMENDTNFGQRFLVLRHCEHMDNRTRRWIAEKALMADEDVGWRRELCREVRLALNDLRDDLSGSRFTAIVERQDGESKLDVSSRQATLAEEITSRWDQVKIPLLTNKARLKSINISLANVLTYMRSSNTESNTVHCGAEAPARVVQQLQRLQRLRAVIDSRTDTNDDDYELSRRVARGSLVPSRLLLLKHLFEATDKPQDSRGVTISQLNTYTNAGSSQIQEILNGLLYNKFVEMGDGYNSKVFYLSEFAFQETQECHILDPI